MMMFIASQPEGQIGACAELALGMQDQRALNSMHAAGACPRVCCESMVRSAGMMLAEKAATVMASNLGCRPAGIRLATAFRAKRGRARQAENPIDAIALASERDETGPRAPVHWAATTYRRKLAQNPRKTHRSGEEGALHA